MHMRNKRGVYFMKPRPGNILEPPMGFDILSIIWEHVPSEVVSWPATVKLSSVLHLVPPRTDPVFLVSNQAVHEILAFVADVGFMREEKLLSVVLSDC
jgi:hypothetical protein